ncbi:small nuclear ribonucleoprotein family protein [Striga asiatica]|uniref:U6 snRNA-associated Sm-like protein LSm1 n=1 Tax=Striga asiatica TaxID=4170 RepID=A0A5A7P6S6_STRAF|nr:small nuclear ribonucleoprotein family protein [Striga asiatica]
MAWAGPEDGYLSTSLASYLDKKLLVLLRDGRKLLGILRSFDQFANAVLEGACERVIVGELYCDIPLGLYIIRGENVVLIGELDLEKEELPLNMTRVSTEEIRRVGPEFIYCVKALSFLLAVNFPVFGQAQKADREPSDLKGTMKRRMDFLDMD